MRSHYAVTANESFVAPIGQHKCDVCSMSFKRKDSLINHSAIHSMVNLKCVICNTEFDNVARVKEHIATHLSDLPFPCEKCDYSFETQEQLEDHELKHAEMEYEELIEQEVIAEARQAAVSRDGGPNEDEEYYSGDDITEFTITNDMDNPEVVRRSKRESKIKNYAEFLKNELGSDLEDEVTDEVQESGQAENEIQEVADESQSEEDTIKPIVRSEGTKVYSRKNVPEKPKFIPQFNLAQAQNMTDLSKITQSTSFDSLSKDISKMPDKGIFNMKIGDKTVMVQKLVLTKQQMKAMAKEGKIEKKGNTLLLKKNPKLLNNVSLDSIFDSTADLGRSQLKKTYQRRAAAEMESGGNNDSSNLAEIDFEEH